MLEMPHTYKFADGLALRGALKERQTCRISGSDACPSFFAVLVILFVGTARQPNTMLLKNCAGYCMR